MFDSFFQIGQFLDISCGIVQEGGSWEYSF